MAPNPLSHYPKRNRFLRRAPNSGSVAAVIRSWDKFHRRYRVSRPHASSRSPDAAVASPFPRRRNLASLRAPPCARVRRAARRGGPRSGEKLTSTSAAALQPEPRHLTAAAAAATARCCCCCCWSYRRLTGGGRCSRRVACEAGPMRAGVRVWEGRRRAGVERECVCGVLA